MILSSSNYFISFNFAFSVIKVNCKIDLGVWTTSIEKFTEFDTVKHFLATQSSLIIFRSKFVFNLCLHSRDPVELRMFKWHILRQRRPKLNSSHSTAWKLFDGRVSSLWFLWRGFWAYRVWVQWSSLFFYLGHLLFFAFSYFESLMCVCLLFMHLMLKDQDSVWKLWNASVVSGNLYRKGWWVSLELAGSLVNAM